MSETRPAGFWKLTIAVVCGILIANAISAFFAWLTITLNTPKPQ